MGYYGTSSSVVPTPNERQGISVNGGLSGGRGLRRWAVETVGRWK